MIVRVFYDYVQPFVETITCINFAGDGRSGMPDSRPNPTASRHQGRFQQGHEEDTEPIRPAGAFKTARDQLVSNYKIEHSLNASYSFCSFNVLTKTCINIIQLLHD